MVHPKLLHDHMTPIENHRDRFVDVFFGISGHVLGQCGKNMQRLQVFHEIVEIPVD